MTMTGPFACIVSNTVKKNANDTWGLIDRDSGGTEEGSQTGYGTFSVALRNKGSGGTSPQAWACYTYLEDVCAAALQPGVSNAQFTAFLQSRAAELSRPMPNNPGQFRAQFQMSQAGADVWTFIGTAGYEAIPADPMAQQQANPKK